ncbi:MAG: metalloprotease PmbA [Proteobacteria bacterium]|nr:metalloprotease PmbA [Pseudomonadota bacterium]MCG6936252.1 metalloprotease PmbA [Pseudomonadota bacterium]
MLAEASRLGASAAEAAVNVEAGLSVNVRLGEVDTLEHNRDKGLGITVYFGQRKGSASTSDFSSKAIRETVQAACDIARFTEADDYAGLADAALMATEIPDLDLYHPWSISAEQAIELARDCEAAGRETDARISNSEGAMFSSHDGLRVYGNSHGFRGHYPRSRHSLSCTLIGQDDKGMQRDYWYTIARNPAELEDAEVVGRKAAGRTVSRLGARRLGTCQVPVIFQADVARGLLGHLLGAINGNALYRKASFLLDQQGKQVFPASVRIDERPHLKGALGSAPFDNEGVTTRARDVVQAGILEGYVLDSYAARRLGMQSTGNAGGVHNLFINHDSVSFEDLQQHMGTGLIVTEVMGQGVNTVTGDYSRGASGFWVENGEIQYPVEEITLASTLQSMYQGVQAIASDVDRRGNICTGSWLIDQMTVAGE